VALARRGWQLDVKWRGQTVTLELPGRGYVAEDVVKVSSKLVADAGIPLLQIDAQPEACSDYSTTWLSFVGGKLRVALALSGLADPPVHASYQVRFDARARTATVVQTNSNDDDPKLTRKRTQRYRLVDGEFKVR
jgi:hypothetical protein